jgi:hypothetical protein
MRSSSKSDIDPRSCVEPGDRPNVRQTMRPLRWIRADGAPGQVAGVANDTNGLTGTEAARPSRRMVFGVARSSASRPSDLGPTTTRWSAVHTCAATRPADFRPFPLARSRPIRVATRRIRLAAQAPRRNRNSRPASALALSATVGGRSPAASSPGATECHPNPLTLKVTLRAIAPSRRSRRTPRRSGS